MMEVFVARQPIFDTNKEVVAYELLYRTGQVNSFVGETDGDKATSGVITDGLMLIGLDALVSGKRAFINFTESLLLNQVPEMFSKDILVVEILENIEPTDEVVEACKRLKEKGYILALDDFVFHEKYQPLIELADIIKVDFLLTTGTERKNVIKRIGNKRIKYLAEKVETIADYEQAIDYGYTYFQGYFFSKPVIVSGQDIPIQQMNYLQLIKEINTRDPDFDRLAEIIERDVAVSYKLLKYINYSGQYLISRILSIKHALMILGLDEIKKWVALVSLRGFGEGKPDIVIKTSMMRAKMGEEIAKQIGYRAKSSEFFLTGMFSMIDVLADRPMADILRELPVSDEIKIALLMGDGILGDVQQLILAYERAEWDKFSKINFKIGTQEIVVPEIYFNALEWTDKTFSIDK